MEILNKTPIYETNYLLCAFIILFVVSLVMTLVFINDKSGLYFALLCMVFLLASVICNSLIERKESGKYRYDVIISDDYSFKEFHEKYKVVDQRGRIWIIEDKDITYEE